ncbi:MAG TPA: ribosome biogenesis GTP-binding protein YihA/YsxC [Candidatus Angelobacter sp.]|nr:ribosome biogenesis GTP-binding protein YihA/YsxC [Candidatus Angelobacter sp.]
MAIAKLVLYFMKPILAKFLASAADPKSFPVEGPPEFAFLGRSNVGKSSLINSLLGHKLAHVSSTPGRTRTINFIGIYAKLGQPNPELMLVDLPGYGYAKISREISAEWPKFIEPYLQDRETLQLSIVLIDSNVPPQEPDRQLIHFLRAMRRDFLAVATKTDKLSGNKLRHALATLAREHMLETILPYSADSGSGRAELWREIRSRTGK